MRTLLIVLTLLIGPAAVQVMAADKLIDRRTYSDRTGDQFYVVFCARAGSPTGHAYVCWGRESMTEGRSVAATFGFYPVQGVGVLGPVPGQLVNEAFNPQAGLLTDRLIVRVDRAVFSRSQLAMNRWATRNYSLWSANCISFTMDVASQVGLVVPAKGPTTFPATYLQALIAAN